MYHLAAYKGVLQSVARDEERKQILHSTAPGFFKLLEQADIVLSIKGEDLLINITINTGPFNVRLMDYNDNLSLQVETRLNVDNSNINAAVPYISQQDSLKDFVIEQTKKYLLENITFHQFVFKLNTTVKMELMEMLERALPSKGWKPSWLQLKSKIDFEIPKQNVAVHYSVRCDIHDYSQKIEVEYKLLLQLNDLGLFKNNSFSISLEEWVEERLNTIIENELFNKRYVDILLDFGQEDPGKQEILNRIREQMQRQANAIGCTVKHLIVQPNMKPLSIMRNGFMLHLKEEIFSTLINRVNVKLDIVITGKISDLGKIHDHITPDKDIEKEMERIVLQETKKQMHAVDPQEFYMPFKYSEGETVEEKLKNAIIRVMTGKFHAHEITVIIKRLENDLIKRILDLVNGSPYHILVDILPLGGGGTQEPIKFEIEFIIQAVSNWNIFTYKNFDPKNMEEIKKITDALQKDIKTKFMTVPYEVLKYSSFEEANRLLKLARMSHAKISAIFGLEINITNLTRFPTEVELAQLKLSLAGKALSFATGVLKDPTSAKEYQDYIISFFIDAAAAGCGKEGLKLLKNSIFAPYVEPLIVALQMLMGEDYNAPLEVVEVAKDVLKKIEEKKNKAGRSKTE
jgi:hypothetical protein